MRSSWMYRYSVYIPPFIGQHLEFSFQACSPQLLKLCQHNSPKHFWAINHLYYIERRRMPKIISVSFRMDRAELIVVHKVLDNLVPGVR